MAGKCCADIVFCIDASGSMEPCLRGVCENVGRLLEGLRSGQQGQGYWDVRFDFLTFQDSSEGVSRYHTTGIPGSVGVIRGLYTEPTPSDFFTRDLEQFRQSLASVSPNGEECHLMALDIALDFPWRPSEECHRVVILLSDEPVETGVLVDMQLPVSPKLIEKIMKKKVTLFIAAPESAAFYELAAVDRCVYKDLESVGDGLEKLDFSDILESIGKSVSVSQFYGGGAEGVLPLFGQSEWVPTQRNDLGSDK